MKPRHRAKLLELAARRGAKGFSDLVAEALETYLQAKGDRETQRKRAVLLNEGVRAPRVLGEPGHVGAMELAARRE
jgi:hypothetical protein